MKNPGIKLFLVLLLPALLVLWMEMNLSRVPNSFTGKKAVFQSRAAQTETLFLGSSQALYGIIPEMISAQTINLASLNQDLYYDHQWLFRYVDSLPKLKRVYVTFTYFTLGYELVKTKEFWRIYFYDRVWQLKPPVEQNDLKKFSWLVLYGPRMALSFARNNFVDPTNVPVTPTGFLPLDSTAAFLPSDSSGKAAVDYHHDFFSFPAITDNKVRIFEMLQLCREKNIEFILLLPPLHSTYRKHELEWIKALNHSLIRDLREVKKIGVLDFSAHPLFTDNCFSDEFHLNNRGARIFSQLVGEEMNRAE